MRQVLADGTVPEIVPFIGQYPCYPVAERPGKLCFLDFLSCFAYNKLELIWITIATLGR